MQQLVWSELKNNEKQLNKMSQLRPFLILGPRDISVKKIHQLTKKLFSQNKPVIWGCLEETFIPGLDGCVQFRSLGHKKLSSALEKLTNLDQNQQQQVSVLRYAAAAAPNIITQLQPSAVIGLNGSWHKAWHYRPEYELLQKLKIPYKLISCFVDEEEALDYDQSIKSDLTELKADANKSYSDQKLMDFAHQESKKSFDYTFQTGAVLARQGEFLLSAHNRVMPYETYMLHHGAIKEKMKTGFQDTSVYDTSHAEMEILIKAMKQGLSLKNCSLYVTLMPCPICAKILARCELKEIIYQGDHSNGYAQKLFEHVDIKTKLIK